MSLTNVEERKKQRRTFILLYAGTIVLVVLIVAAFFLSRPVAVLYPVAVNGQDSLPVITAVDPPLVEKQEPALKIENQGDQVNMQQADSLVAEVKARDRQIIKMQKRLKDLPAPASTPKNNNEGELKFLRWALSSQSSETNRLKMENAKLKAAITGLKSH